MRETSKGPGVAVLALMLAAVAGSASGCAYGGVAATPDGTVVIARNDLLLFGLLRKVYVCRPSGGALVCAEAPAP